MESKSNIYKKLAAVKAKIGKLTKDTSNPFFKSKYADINQLIEMTDPVLLEAGLLSLQPIEDGHVVTKIVDIDSGETITSSLKLPESNDPQKVGSAITYFRRYSLKALLNIGEEDDDANNAAGNDTKPNQSSNQSAPSNAPWANDNEVNIAIDRINKGETGVLEEVLSKFKISKANRAKIESAISNYRPPVDKPEVKPGTPEWDKCKSWLLAHRSEAHKLVINYRFDDADYDKLLAEVDKEIESKSLDALEAIDAIKSASDMASLNQIYNDCQALHTNKAFVDAYAARQKELAKLGKAA